MFTKIQLITTLAFLIAQSPAEATSLHPDTFQESAEIKTMSIDPDNHLAHYDFSGGRVIVSQGSGTVSLVLDPSRNCFDEFCIEIAPEPITIELPIVDLTQENSCGEPIIVAERDARPADGNLQRIEIVDPRVSDCDYVRKPDTRITWTTVTAGFVFPVLRTESFFTAEQLKLEIPQPTISHTTKLIELR